MTVWDELISLLLAGDVRRLPDGSVDPKQNPMLDAMAVCAATPELRQDACAAALRFMGISDVSARDVRNRLAETLWLDESADGGARVRPVLGLLLRRWLARDPEKWREAHRGYVGHYARAEEIVTRHYHKLALVEPSQKGELTEVVTFLEREYARLPPERWHDDVLAVVTSAPTLLRTARGPASFVVAFAGQPNGTQRQTVTRLTVARWLHNDRLFDPDHQLAKLIAEEYDDLARLFAPDPTVFNDAADEYWALHAKWHGRTR